ncbi:MAG: cytochrome ubiquinol oxidase subunit I [Parachlamydiales bacterium]
MTALILSRIQFALTIGFHYLYPPLSIGLSVFIILIEALYLKRRDPKYLNIAKFWTKAFALTFAMGVATGIVMVFQFGTNWAHYSKYVGDVFGAVLGAEGIFAFLVEAGFLGVLLFGWDRVSKGFHFFSTCMVSFGAHFSAVWIVIANSWMQTPSGHVIVGTGADAHAELKTFSEVIFNPSSMDRLVHVLIAAWLTGAFFVLSVSAYYLIKQRHLEFARTSMKVGLIFAVVMIVAQTISGDSSARTVVEYQPTKLAAMEGVFKTQKSAPLFLIGFPDPKTNKTYGISIPGLLSFLSYRSFSAEIQGMDSFPKEDLPNTRAVFQTYRIMLAMWAAMLFTAAAGWILWRRIREGRAKWLLWVMVFSVAFPQLANQAGWFTAEMGRQPWIIYGIMRTADGYSKSVSAPQIISSITVFAAIYIALFSLFLFLLDRKIKKGPHEPIGELHVATHS